MAELKIGVKAGVEGVDQAIAKITQRMNALAQAVGKSQNLKVEPTDMKLMSRDLDLINKNFKQTIALSSQLRNAMKATGQSNAPLHSVDFSKLSTNPQVAQRLRDRAFLHSVRGTSLDPTLANEVDHNGNIVPSGAGGGAGTSGGGSGGGGGNRRPPRGGDEEGVAGGGWRRKALSGIGRGVQAFGRGAGGGVGTATEAASAGAEGAVGAAAEGAGMMGMAAAFAPIAIGVVAFKAAEALGKLAAEGMDLAKQQNETADTLKRSMGDLGVSFHELTGDSRYFGQKIGVAGGEFLKLEEQANSASGGLYRTPKELEAATLSGGSLARAYGMQTGAGVGFVAGMDRLNNRQNNKELATAIAEAIGNAQGKATPGEVMQAMQSFAASQNRFNSGSVDLNRVGNAYSSLLGSDGMTADHASDILGTANAAMQRMGGTEASQNFTMQAFGNLNPLMARIRAEGGLFGNGLDNKDIGAYVRARGGADWDSRSKGPAGDNFSVITGSFDSAYRGRDPLLELNAEKNYFGLKSNADTASFVRMSDSDHNGLNMLLQHAGVNLSDLNEGSLQPITAISKASDFKGLDALYRSGPDAIRNRGDMSDADKARLDTAEKSGNFQQMQDALVRTLSGKGQADDDTTVQRSIDSNIENIKSQIGERLVPLAQASTQAMLWMANKFGAGIAMPAMPGERAKPADKTLPQAIADSHVTRGGAGGLHTATGGTLWDKGLDAVTGMYNSGRRAIGDTRLSGLEQQYGLPKGLLDAVWGAETSWGANNRTSSAGAKGNFQMLDGTAKQYGVQIGSFLSESDGAARMYRDLLKGNGGNLDKALAAYNWGQGNLNKDIKAHGDDWLKFAPKATQDYIAKIDPRYRKGAQDGSAGGGGGNGGDGSGSFTVILEQTNNTTVDGRTKTKKVSATVGAPQSAGGQARVKAPTTNTNVG